MKNEQGEAVGSVSKTLSSQESQLAVHQESYVARAFSGICHWWSDRARTSCYGVLSFVLWCRTFLRCGHVRWSGTAPNLCPLDRGLAAGERWMVFGDWWWRGWWWPTRKTLMGRTTQMKSRADWEPAKGQITACGFSAGSCGGGVWFAGHSSSTCGTFEKWKPWTCKAGKPWAETPPPETLAQGGTRSLEKQVLKPRALQLLIHDHKPWLI